MHAGRYSGKLSLFYHHLRVAADTDEGTQEFMRSGRPLLLGSGMPEALLNQIEQNAIRELMEARTPIYIRCQYVYATRKHPQPRA